MSSQYEESGKWIDIYINLQRIKTAPDPQKEVDYQLSIAKAHLQTLGVPTEDLDKND